MCKVMKNSRDVPWWFPSAKNGNSMKKIALNRLKRPRSIENNVALKKARALDRHTRRIAKKITGKNGLTISNQI